MKSASKKSRVSRQIATREREHRDAQEAHQNLDPARNKSRAEGQRGHGGEGFSKGYGGGAGDGISSPSGPEETTGRSTLH